MRAEAGQVEGVAYVLPFSPNFHARQTHRVYLKDMLLSERAENLLPDWAFFVRCVVNAQELRPTASREAFYEDATLARARAALGQCLRQYLVDLATHEPRTLQRLIALHGLSVKSFGWEPLPATRDQCINTLSWLDTMTSLHLGRVNFTTTNECVRKMCAFRFRRAAKLGESPCVTGELQNLKEDLLAANLALENLDICAPLCCLP